MKLNINNHIKKALILEIAEAVTRSHQTQDAVLRTIANSHPEITYSEEEWYPIEQETKEKILARIRKSLAAM